LWVLEERKEFAVVVVVVAVIDLVLCSVGYHHAGMDVDDRKLVERMFSQGHLAVLS